MSNKNRFFKGLFSVLLMASIVLANVSVAFADDATPPEPTATEAPTEEPAGTTPTGEAEIPPATETPAPEDEQAPLEEGDVPTEEAGISVEEEQVPAEEEGISVDEEQVPAGEEASDPALFEQIPGDTDVVVLDENGNPVPLVSEEALNAILEDDPMWCPAGVQPGGAGCRNFTGANGITNLLTDMRNNTNAYDENGIIYFTANPGNGPFTLTNAGSSLSGDFNTLSNFNITLQGGWNGSTINPQFNTQTNFGTNYVAIGTAANPWVGNVTVNNITVDGHTSGSNSSVGVFTTSGSVSLNNILVDDADNNESVEVVTNTGNITLNNVNITDGDDNQGIDLTTNSGAVSLTNVSVDDHTDADSIWINANNGNVTLNDVDVTDGDDGNGITIATTGGNVTVGNGSLVDNQSDGDGIHITTGSGNVTFDNFDVDDQSNGDSIDVTTNSGDITLGNVDVTDHSGGYTASLVSQSGDILVNNGSDFEGDNINRGFFASTNTGSITITGTSGNPITFLDAYGCGTFFGFCFIPTLVNYNGATLSAPTVNLNYVTANNNDLNGIYILNASTVNLSNVTANNNGSDMLTQPDTGDVGSGVYVSGTGSTVVNITGGTFTGNERYGVEVISGSIVVVSLPTCSANDLGCLYDEVPPVLSLPADMTVEASSASGAIVSYSASATDSIDGPLAVTCAPISGSVFALGSTTVNCSVTDSNNHTTNGSFNVTVQDTTPPTLTLPADITTEAVSPSGASVTFSASASDLVDGPVSVTCSHASGDTFPVGTTAVNCSATDSHSNTANGSFNVVVQDTTAPVIAPHEDITIVTDRQTGEIVMFTAPATFDVVDGAGVATCAPTSGSKFPVGTTTVTCTATDSHGNTAVPVTFLVTLEYEPRTIPTTILPGGLFITVTGGELIELDCFSIVNAFGIKITFHNMCNHQAVITEVGMDLLPEPLPEGVSLVAGLDIDVLFDKLLVKELPVGSGIQLDFPIPTDSQDQYAVLLWDEENKQWLDVTQTMEEKDLNEMLFTDAEDELYQIMPTEITRALYRALSTEKPGTFVIVKK